MTSVESNNMISFDDKHIQERKYFHLSYAKAYCLDKNSKYYFKKLNKNTKFGRLIINYAMNSKCIRNRKYFKLSYAKSYCFNKNSKYYFKKLNKNTKFGKLIINYATKKLNDTSAKKKLHKLLSKQRELNKLTHRLLKANPQLKVSKSMTKAKTEAKIFKKIADSKAV